MRAGGLGGSEIARRRTSKATRQSNGLVLPSASRPSADGTAPATGSTEATVGGGTGPGGTATLVADAVPVSARVRRPLGELLVEQRKVTEGDVTWAVGQQEEDDAEGRPRRLLGELLVERGVINQADVLTAVADQLGLQVLELRRESPDPSVVELIDEDQARDLAVIPVRRVSDGIVVAAADPASPGLADVLANTFGEPVVIRVASRADVERAQNRAFKAVSHIAEHVKVFEARAETLKAAADDLSTSIDENAPVVQVVSLILSQAVRDRASDVHVEPMGDRVRIRNRVDGALHEVLSLPQSMALALASRIKIMAGLNIVERRRPQDGQIEFTVDGRDLDIRVSTTSTVHGEKTVLRILDKTQTSYGLRDLGMPDDVSVTFEEIIRSPYGMVICAGPTGSGKTTTLYATLSEINNEEINVMTVEDPVEYVFPTINQIQINEQAGVTFAGGLRSILRQDPDAILVGEIRDVETARIAIQAALTGHFVLSTIHATDATSALHRFIDMGIESFLIASSMLAMVGQRLVRRVCPECKVEYLPTDEELAFFDRSGGDRPAAFYRGAGCAYCSDTGYHSRIGVYEVLRITDEMKQLLVENAPHAEMKALAIKQGMSPLRDQAVRLAASGDTTIAEVLRTIYVL